MDLREIGRGWGGCGVDSPGLGQGSMAGCCVCGDEPSGYGATELVSLMIYVNKYTVLIYSKELKHVLQFVKMYCVALEVTVQWN
jgi:hypothetical protein